MYRTDSAPAAGLTGASFEVSRKLSGWERALKRVIDVVGAALLLVLFAPLLLLVAIGVGLSSGWPVIYSHKRVGRGGKVFAVHKFRSMRKDADQVLSEFLDSSPEAREEWRSFHKLRNDPRITRFGRFLRSSSLDEFPQLWNVIKGEMSLVGPRPVTEAERDRYGPKWRIYCAMRPGITGMWQVNGRNVLTYSERIAFDVRYVSNWSILLDLKILAKTIAVVLRRDGSM